MLIDSYARPGRNVTGVAIEGVETGSKRYEVLRALAPSAQHMAILAPDPTGYSVSGSPVINIWPSIFAAAKAQGFDCSVHVAKRIENVDAALAEAIAARAGVISIGGATYVGAAAGVAEVVMHQRWVSSTNDWDLFTAASLSVFYGISEDEFGRMIDRSLEMVDRILRGASPAHIPVALPTRYELWLNLKATRALGIKVPQDLMLRVDRVIE